jgi:hypothetical protein
LSRFPSFYIYSSKKFLVHPTSLMLYNALLYKVKGSQMSIDLFQVAAPVGYYMATKMTSDRKLQVCGWPRASPTPLANTPHG